MVLELGDSLGLSDDQVTVLQMVRDSLDTETEVMAAKLQEEIEEYGTNQNPRGLIDLMRPYNEEARIKLREVVSQVRSILTEEQWGQLPPQMRNFGRRGPGRRPG